MAFDEVRYFLAVMILVSQIMVYFHTSTKQMATQDPDIHAIPGYC